MPHRFFVDPGQITGDTIRIIGPDVRHILKVLRLKIGDELIVADGTGLEYFGRIASLDKSKVVVTAFHKQQALSEAPVKVTLLQGIPKGDKMDFIVQKCTELGVSRIVPVVTKRTVVQLSEEKAKARRQRWQRIAEEAAKQSQRASIPVVEEVILLQEALEKHSDQPLLVLWEGEKSQTMKEVLKNHREKSSHFALLIGPEGGLDPEEVALAKARQAWAVTLGPRILRTETAGLAALTMILYELGDLGGTNIGS